jgi:tRNA(fMet)-specific endonuclease VapC
VDYLLDTNACIALINGEPPSVRSRVARANDAGEQIFVSSIGFYELCYGAEKSKRQTFNRQRLAAFRQGPLNPLSFEEDDAWVAGKLRADLEAIGRPIGAYDILIAAQALRHSLTLITANVREFSRVKGLKWQDWAKWSRSLIVGSTPTEDAPPFAVFEGWVRCRRCAKRIRLDNHFLCFQQLNPV